MLRFVTGIPPRERQLVTWFTGPADREAPLVRNVRNVTESVAGLTCRAEANAGKPGSPATSAATGA